MLSGAGKAKIDRVEQPRTVCGAEEWRGVSKMSKTAEWCREGVGQTLGSL